MLAINEVVSVGACRTPIDFLGQLKLPCANELSVITVAEAIQPDDRVIWEDFALGIDQDKTNYNSSGIALGHPAGCPAFREHLLQARKAPVLRLGGAPLCGRGAAMDQRYIESFSKPGGNSKTYTSPLIWGQWPASGHYPQIK